ncbi:hypothetical protein Q6316_28445, partial [Klebsiella pneumoniae]|nr:hypothetical protein [Klebsiella pneumoniae]
IFVPGIMGSNLRTSGRITSTDKAGQESAIEAGTPVWRLDNTFGAPISLAWHKAWQRPGARQKTLHPDRVEVDAEGAVPSRPAGSVLNAD